MIINLHETLAPGGFSYWLLGLRRVTARRQYHEGPGKAAIAPGDIS